MCSNKHSCCLVSSSRSLLCQRGWRTARPKTIEASFQQLLSSTNPGHRFRRVISPPPLFQSKRQTAQHAQWLMWWHGAKLSSSQAQGCSVSPPESDWAMGDPLGLLPGRGTSPPLAVIGRCRADGPASWIAGVFSELSRLSQTGSGKQTLTTALGPGICDRAAAKDREQRPGSSDPTSVGVVQQLHSTKFQKPSLLCQSTFTLPPHLYLISV